LSPYSRRKMTESLQPGLYVHIPFCRTKCPYCDFYSVTSLSSIPDWLDAIKRETLLYRDRFSRFDSLYLGGGTPSLLMEHNLASLVDSLKSNFSITDDAEFTVEMNPDDITSDQVPFFRKLGVNRISLGVQSFDDQELRFLKRRHTAGQAAKALGAFKGAGFAKVGVDLMYGLPGQTQSSWLKTLEQSVSFEPEHISCYQLTIHESTPFGRLKAKGELNMPGDEDESVFFILTSDFLQEKGYLHYEISNFARGEENLCRHNLKYWRRTPYLGLGPSAHSYQGGARWWNLPDIDAYCRALVRGKSPVAGAETLTAEQVYLETLLLGFRTRDGVNREFFRDRPGTEEVLRHLRQAGLVQVVGERVVPTVRGFLMADSLSLAFAD
jgi:putative oxygen-independent coproporphyrinogen III oxidase